MSTAARTNYLAFPYDVDGRGRTAETTHDGHVRDLIHQVLFTAPGERLNHPDFGCGVGQLVFTPNSEALASTTQFLVLGALTRWLGHLIDVRKVEVAARDNVLSVSVEFVSLSTGELRDEQFDHAGGGT